MVGGRGPAPARADATGDGRVLILPTASAKEGDEVFDGWGSKGLEHFDSLGIAGRGRADQDP